jgi:hypothetical protein
MWLVFRYKHSLNHAPIGQSVSSIRISGYESVVANAEIVPANSIRSSLKVSRGLATIGSLMMNGLGNDLVGPPAAAAFR